MDKPLRKLNTRLFLQNVMENVMNVGTQISLAWFQYVLKNVVVIHVKNTKNCLA